MLFRHNLTNSEFLDMSTEDNPLKLHTRQFGENGPSLIVLHGLFGSWENWRSHAQQLASHYRVTLMDLRNHGQSGHRDHMDYSLMAADVAFTCEQLGIEQSHVLGHSMGGKTAMQLAVDYTNLVDRLIVVDIAPREYPAHHQKILQGMGLLHQKPLDSRKIGDEILSEFVADKGIRSFLLKNLTRTDQGKYQLRLNLHAIVNQYSSIASAIDIEGRTMPATKSPVLFIKGGNSDYLQEKDRTTILALFPSARVKVVAGTGHWLHSEKPDLVQKIISDFLGE